MSRRTKIKKKIKAYAEYYWLIFIAVSVLLLFSQSYSLYKDIRAKKWPAVLGHIDIISIAGKVPSPRYGPIIEPQNHPEICFSYDIDGKYYASCNISFGFTFSEDFAKLSPTAADNRVKVFFNPDDPREAVLIPGPKLINIACIIFLLMMFSASVRQLIKSRNEQQSHQIDKARQPEGRLT